MNEKLTQEECVRIYEIEIGFLDSLEESGLLHPMIENNIKYILYDELPQVEQFANWHYDLEVNLPGIEVIHRLLEKIKTLQSERMELLSKLQFHPDIEL